MKKMLLVVAVFTLSLVTMAEQNERVVDVMSLNIRLDHKGDKKNNWKYRKESMVEMIRYTAPDIIGMQEVLKNQFDYIKRYLPQYQAVGVGREDGAEKGEFCPLFFNAERYRLIENGNFSLSETPHVIGVKGWDAACERIVTWVILEERATGEQLAVFNTHFDHVGVVARRESAKLIVAQIKLIANGLPLVLMGDFNEILSAPGCAVLIESGLQESRSVAPITYGPEWSFYAFGRLQEEKRLCIDFIFVSEEFKVLNHRVIDGQPIKGYLSDHTPLLTSLMLKKR